ncbi:hypothetical protein FIV42_12895 [Persicimonas caeni]|uniref:EI24 domain-containing protein n=1 Tax=Persicimonas caeni TaxID=2292766 RepID=A0A4Y6PTG4_PERCE|nr:EI24 domain-containing protein [Persicimonas caeni]QDG51612.1 hypothetical protein FIV42_12895 [Persicimonas caeni]QED32833.1 hypothetical protein FRD00_12890 [Persicimonas caeni]
MHELLEDLKQARRGSTIRQVTRGLTLPFRAARFLKENKKLVPFVIVPALINAVLFAISAYLLLTNAGDIVDWLWEKPVVDGLLSYLLIVLWYFVYVLCLLAAVVLSYVVVLVAGGIVASPFHDFLSEHTERILRGVDDVSGPDESIVGDLLRSIGSSAFIGLMYASLMLPILLLNFIPGIGNVTSTVLSACVSAFFVALEYTDPTLQRHGVKLRDKFGLIWDNLPLTGSFGLGTSLLLWVPLMNFICMPIAVIGGTALGIALEED